MLNRVVTAGALALLVTGCGGAQMPSQTAANTDPSNPSQKKADATSAHRLTPASEIEADRKDPYQAPDGMSDDHFRPVTREYGPLVVREQDDKELTVTKKKPWSGWWLPYKDTYLFATRKDGTKSTLQKLDQLLTKRGVLTKNKSENGKQLPNELTSYTYEDRVNGKFPMLQDGPINEEIRSKVLYNENAPGWYGRCEAWAAAALAEPEPKAPKTIDDVVFTVGDQKALLVKMYEKAGFDYSKQGLKPVGKVYGTKYDEDDGSKHSFDLYPDEFHKFLQETLFKDPSKGEPEAFIMDYDPGTPVWNVPAYKGKTTIKWHRGDKDSGGVNYMDVVTDIYAASPPLTPTLANKPLLLDKLLPYAYRLYGDGDKNNFKVRFGKWVRVKIVREAGKADRWVFPEEKELFDSLEMTDPSDPDSKGKPSVTEIDSLTNHPDLVIRVDYEAIKALRGSLNKFVTNELVNEIAGGTSEER